MPADKQEEKKTEELPRIYRQIPSKHIADVLESLIGVVFKTYQDQDNSLNICQQFLYLLGVLKKQHLQMVYLFPNSLQQSQAQLNEIARNVTVDRFRQLEQIIGYKFKNVNLLIQAFTHQSLLKPCNHILYPFDSSKLDQHLNLKKPEQDLPQFISNSDELLEKKFTLSEQIKVWEFSYERLEFLGDSVLDLIVVEYLYRTYPDCPPGEMTGKKQSCVCNRSLALVSLYYSLFEYIFIDDSEYKDIMHELKGIFTEENYYKSKLLQNRGHSELKFEESIKILGDILEALVGAIFVDTQFNYKETKQVINKLFHDRFVLKFLKEGESYSPQKELEKMIKVMGFDTFAITP